MTATIYEELNREDDKPKRPRHGLEGEPCHHGTTDKETLTTNGLDADALGQQGGDNALGPDGTYFTQDVDVAEEYANLQAFDRKQNPRIVEVDDADIQPFLEPVRRGLAHGDERFVPIESFPFVPKDIFRIFGEKQP